ncbi:glutamine repeat protein-1 [Apiospora kogelbergensis]
MMPGVGPAAGMMQNAGMPHMANGQSKPASHCLPSLRLPLVFPTLSLDGALFLSPSPASVFRIWPGNRLVSDSVDAARRHESTASRDSHAGLDLVASPRTQTFRRLFLNTLDVVLTNPVAPQMNAPPNYAMGAGMPMPGFPMHPGQMNPQQQQQMMQRQNQGHSQGPGPQGTPTPSNGMSAQQPQFAPPSSHQGTPQSQTPTNAQHPQPQQPPSATIQTPQTPTFPSNVHGAATNGTVSTPLSPGADSRDKERVSIILEINNELLVEAMHLQHTQSLLKKEHTTPVDGIPSEADKKNKEEEELLAQDYLQCMRRLQTNLSYLAALADKKGALQAPPCPMYLKPPPLHTKVKLRPMQNPDGAEAKPEASDRDETAKYMTDLYTKLQGLYPDIDPSKEPTYQVPANRSNNTKPGVQTPSQASPVPGNKKTPTMTAAPAPQMQMHMG